MNILPKQNKILHLILKINEDYIINYKNINNLKSIKCFIGESIYLVITKNNQINFFKL